MPSKKVSRSKATNRMPKGRNGSAKLRHTKGERKAGAPAKDSQKLLSASPPQANGKGLFSVAEKASPCVPIPVRDLCEQIRAHHKERCFAMEQRKRMNNALGAYVRTQLGWHLGLSEQERNLVAKQASKAISEADDPRFASIIEANEQAAGAFVAIERVAEKEMAKFAAQLPVWQQFESVRGFGIVSLAVIVGEAGDLSNYSNHSKLWKRMGLAVLDGIRQGGLAKGSKAEDWIAHGYNPQRRSRVFVIGDSLIKGNRDGRYRTIYLARKAYEIARNPEIKPIAAHRRAQRYMEKRLLRDLWQAWRAVKDVLPEKAAVGLPAIHSDAPQGAGASHAMPQGRARFAPEILTPA